jgi:hypothetical protein
VLLPGIDSKLDAGPHEEGKGSARACVTVSMVKSTKVVRNPIFNRIFADISGPPQVKEKIVFNDYIKIRKGFGTPLRYNRRYSKEY